MLSDRIFKRPSLEFLRISMLPNLIPCQAPVIESSWSWHFNTVPAYGVRAQYFWLYKYLASLLSLSHQSCIVRKAAFLRFQPDYHVSPIILPESFACSSDLRLNPEQSSSWSTASGAHCSSQQERKVFEKSPLSMDFPKSSAITFNRSAYLRGASERQHYPVLRAFHWGLRAKCLSKSWSGTLDWIQWVNSTTSKTTEGMLICSYRWHISR